MTSLRSHIADVLHADLFGAEPHNGCCPCFEEADALLADPTLAAIIDLAATYVAWHQGKCDLPVGGTFDLNVEFLLTDWRKGQTT